MLTLDERRQLVAAVDNSVADVAGLAALEAARAAGYRGGWGQKPGGGTALVVPNGDPLADRWWTSADPSNVPEPLPQPPIINPLLPPPPLTIFDDPQDDVPDAAFRARWR